MVACGVWRAAACRQNLELPRPQSARSGDATSGRRSPGGGWVPRPFLPGGSFLHTPAPRPACQTAPLVGHTCPAAPGGTRQHEAAKASGNSTVCSWCPACFEVKRPPGPLNWRAPASIWGPASSMLPGGERGRSRGRAVDWPLHWPAPPCTLLALLTCRKPLIFPQQPHVAALSAQQARGFGSCITFAYIQESSAQQEGVNTRA